MTPLRRSMASASIVRAATAAALAQASPAQSSFVAGYRAPKTIRSAQLSVTHIGLQGGVHMQWKRGFWGKKPEPTDTEAAATESSASAVSEAARPTAGPAPAPVPVPAASSSSRSTTTTAPSLYAASDRGGASKTDRLGFGSVVSAFNSFSFSWPRFKTYMVWIGVGAGVLMVFKVGLNIVDFFGQTN